MNIHEVIKQLESCKFTCEAGPLENNEAFIELKAFATYLKKFQIENSLKRMEPS